MASDEKADGSKHLCHVCLKKFSRKDSLKRHVENVHDKKTFPCPSCKKVFKRKTCLNVHVKNIHKVKKIHKVIAPVEVNGTDTRVEVIHNDHENAAYEYRLEQGVEEGPPKKNAGIDTSTQDEVNGADIRLEVISNDHEYVNIKITSTHVEIEIT